MVEFAIVLPLLLLVIVGLIEFGITFNSWLSLNHLSNEGARWAAVGRVPGNATPTGDDIKNYIENQISSAGLKGQVTGTNGYVTLCVPSATPQVGDPVTVKIGVNPYSDLQPDGFQADGRQPERVVDNAPGEGTPGNTAADHLGLDGLLSRPMTDERGSVLVIVAVAAITLHGHRRDGDRLRELVRPQASAPESRRRCGVRGRPRVRDAVQELCRNRQTTRTTRSGTSPGTTPASVPSRTTRASTTRAS